MKAIALIVVFGLAVAGCKDEPKETPAEKAAREMREGPDLKGGTRHDPAVAKSEIPAGHYFCDMGKVHYSRPDKGDGECPICHMDLVQKPAE